MPSLPGLDSRETAFALWAFAIIAFAVARSAGFRDSGRAFLKLFLWSKLTLFVVVLTAYLASMICVLWLVGYWDVSMTKATVFWFVGTALVTAFSSKRKDGRQLARLVRRHLSLAAALIYVMNIHPFPLYVWLVLVPLILMLGGILGLAKAQPQYANLKKPIEGALTLIGLAAFAFSLDYSVAHYHELMTGERVREFFLPLILTICFLPLLYGLALWIVYDGLLGMVRFGLHGNDALYRHARREIVGACGLRLARAQLFGEKFRPRLWGATEVADVRRVVADFERTWQSVERGRQAQHGF